MMIKKCLARRKAKFEQFVYEYKNAYSLGLREWMLWTELKIIFRQVLLIIAVLILACARKWVWAVVALIMLIRACWLYWYLEFREDEEDERE